MESFHQKYHSLENWSPKVTLRWENCNIRWDEEEVAKSKTEKGTWTRSKCLNSLHHKSQTGWTHSQESSVRDHITSTAEKHICYFWKKDTSRKLMKRQRYVGKTMKLIPWNWPALLNGITSKSGSDIFVIIWLILQDIDLNTYSFQIKKQVLSFRWLLWTMWTMLPGGV